MRIGIVGAECTSDTASHATDFAHVVAHDPHDARHLGSEVSRGERAGLR